MKAKSVSLVGISVAVFVGVSLFDILPSNDTLPKINIEFEPVVAVPEETTTTIPTVIEPKKMIEEVPIETPTIIPSSPIPPLPHKKKAILDGVSLGDLGDLLKGMSGGVGAKKLRDGSKDYRGMVGKTIELPVNWDRKLLRKWRRWKKRQYRKQNYTTCTDLSCRISGTYRRR